MVDRAPPLALPSPDDAHEADLDADLAGGPLAFTPVVKRHLCHNGWTATRQRGFIAALADTGSVQAACAAVGMRTGGAYRLRRAPDGAGFRAAWAAALDLGLQRVEDVAMDRALNGVEEPVYSYGKLVGTRVVRNDRLLMFLLRNRAGDRFGGNAGPRGNLNAGRLKELKTQWEAERKEELRLRAARTRKELAEKLAVIGERLAAGPDPVPPDDTPLELLMYRATDPRHDDPDWVPPWEERGEEALPSPS